ncbi:MAG: hypothetical protein ACH34X_05935 [Thiolinea sp.]
MKPFGLASLIFSIFGLIVPILGPFISGLSGVLAFFAAGKGNTLGLTAIIINIINALLLSPSLVLSTQPKNAFTGVTYTDPTMVAHAHSTKQNYLGNTDTDSDNCYYSFLYSVAD